ncbi:MAG: hypothetical protein WCC74_01785 [Minisyncoccia bacterium]
MAYQQRIGVTIETLSEEIQCIINTVAKKPLISFRVKDPETLRKKMQIVKTQDVFSIHDIYGIRVIVESIEEVYAVLTKISQEFSGYLVHDYFKIPKAVPSVNGKILRLVQYIAYKNGVSFEIQITTVACCEVNESLHQGYHDRKYCSQNPL